MKHVLIGCGAFFCACLLSLRVGAADFDYRLQAQVVAAGVKAFIGATEDFNTRNGGNIVNTGVIEVGNDPARLFRARHDRDDGVAVVDQPRTEIGHEARH